MVWGYLMTWHYRPRRGSYSQPGPSFRFIRGQQFPKLPGVWRIILPFGGAGGEGQTQPGILASERYFKLTRLEACGISLCNVIKDYRTGEKAKAEMDMTVQL